MPVSVKLDPIAKDLIAEINKEFSPQGQSKQFADYARVELAKAQETNRRAFGSVPPHEAYVDGRKGAPFDSVRPDGVIQIEFELLQDVFEWIGSMLIRHSPVLTGRYRRSHVFFAGNLVVEPSDAVPPADEYSFVNIQPYARRIERGWSDQAPDGVYETVASLANKRFSNIARIRFSYRAPLFGSIDEWANRTGLGAHRKKDRAEWLRRQPAIVITPR